MDMTGDATKGKGVLPLQGTPIRCHHAIAPNGGVALPQ